MGRQFPTWAYVSPFYLEIYMTQAQFNETAPKKDLYQTVTDTIVDMIESGEFEKWRKSWRGGLARNLSTEAGYKGVNTLLLANSMIKNKFAKPYFLTLKQANALGGKVKKDSASTMIIYWNIQRKELDQCDESGEPIIEERCYLRQYSVFNVAQIEGLDEQVSALATKYEVYNEHEQIEEAEQWVRASGAEIIHGGSRAFFMPSQDRIQLPELSQFDSANDYYSAAFHELAHWTGHETRLARDFSGRFGDEAYAFEELIAELCASFIDAQLGFSGFQMPNHTSYIAGWLKVLKNDKKAIFTASSQASMAFQYLADLKANYVDDVLEKVA